MTERRSVPELFSDLVTSLTSLFRTEARLARAEVSEKVSQAVMATALLVGGAVLMIPALVILLQAAVAGLIEGGMEAHWAALLVGGAALLIGLIIAFVGMNRLKPANLVPSKTLEQLQQDAEIARRQVR